MTKEYYVCSRCFKQVNSHGFPLTKSEQSKITKQQCANSTKKEGECCVEFFMKY